MANRIAILGGGFAGMCAAYLARKANFDVTIYEPSGGIGGVLQGVEVFGEKLDLGCHLFDNDSDELSEILFELVGSENFFYPVDPTYKSTLNGVELSDIAVPDFRDLSDEELAVILNEIKKGRGSLEFHCKNLEQTLFSRFGCRLGERLAKISEKLFQERPQNLDSSVLDFSPFKRVRLRDNITSERLKRDPVFDDVLAIRGKTLGQYTSATKYSCRNFYPKEGGTASFVNKFRQNLDDLGVAVVTRAKNLKLQTVRNQGIEIILDGKSLDYDYVLSTLDAELLSNALVNQVPLTFSSRSVPMCLCYFQIDAESLGDIAYLNNFSISSSIFRVSAPVNYIPTSADRGLAHICVECPTEVDSELWNSNIEILQKSLFEELKALSFVVSNAKPRKAQKFNVARTYTVKKVGYQQELELFEAKIRRDMPNLLFMDGMSKSKSQLLTECLAKLEQITGFSWKNGINNKS